MRIKFWGVRGSTPTPQAENLRYGGNTPCVEFRSDYGSLLIADCGSGLRMLGKSLMAEFGPNPIRGHVLLSHYHWDHIQGLPFFAPLYGKANQFHFYSYRLPGTSLEKVLEGQMANPYFPVDMGAMRAIRTFSEIHHGPIRIDDFAVHAREVNHPQGCLSFRIESVGKAVLYATDNEPGDAASEQALLELARDADVLIFDSQYSWNQIRGPKKGWGHNTWEEGFRICREAGAKQLVLFHHDPDHDDATIDKLQALARSSFPNCSAAYEGMEITI